MANGTPSSQQEDEELPVTKPEWGTKRICQSCGARFYDLRKSPIECPKCAFSFEPEALYKQRRPRQPEPQPAAVVNEREEDEETEEEEAETEVQPPELGTRIFSPTPSRRIWICFCLS